MSKMNRKRHMPEYLPDVDDVPRLLEKRGKGILAPRLFPPVRETIALGHVPDTRDLRCFGLLSGEDGILQL